MEKEPKFKPGQIVKVKNVRAASEVGYLGVYLKILDYESRPELIKRDENGVPLYMCESLKSGDWVWFYEDEL